MTTTNTAALERELEAFQSAPGDPVNAALAALALGALAERAIETARRAVASMAPELRARLVSVISEQHRRHRTKIGEILSRVASNPRWLESHAIVTDDPAQAEHLQRQALDALSSREALHRLEQGATLIDAQVGESLRLDRVAVDDQLRTRLPTWAALAPWRSRCTDALGNDSAAVEARWWIQEWPSEPDDADFENAEEAVAQVAAWVRKRRVEQGGRLMLTAEEANALLASETGRQLAQELSDQLDLSALLPPHEERAETAEAPKTVLQTWLGALKGRLREVAEQLTTVMAPPLESSALASTDAWRPVTSGFDAIARFLAQGTTLVPGIGLVSIGSMPSDGNGSDDSLMRPALLVVPAADVRSLGIQSEHPIEANAWRGGGLLWAPPTLDTSIAIAVVRADGSHQVSVDLRPVGEPDVQSVLLRALATGDLNEAKELIVTAQAVAADDIPAGCTILLDALGPGDSTE